MDLVCSSLTSWPRYFVLHIPLLRFIQDLDTDGNAEPSVLHTVVCLYIHAMNVWIVFLLFKGSDLHSEFTPMEDPEAHKCWVDNNFSAA